MPAESAVEFNQLKRLVQNAIVIGKQRVSAE
jgi:hypothetical protein